MSYEAKVVADSISEGGVRLTTLQVTYPHAIHKDIMTHRMFSRNFQSFRAYPPEKVIDNIVRDPFVPEQFNSRVVGMGEGEAIEDQESANLVWQQHINNSLATARTMLDLNLAKAQVNFVLQDLTWITGLITATEWDNFWELRADADDVRPEVKKIASMMKGAYESSNPYFRDIDEWHLPLLTDDEWAKVLHTGDWHYWRMVSIGRCARVSYLTHDGKRDTAADIALHNRLKGDRHMSPFEHVATPMEITNDKWILEMDPDGTLSGRLIPGPNWSANFFGWRQHREDVDGR